MLAPEAANTLPRVLPTKIRPGYKEEIREHFTSSCEYGKDFIKFEDISDVLETCGERVPAYKLRQKLPEFGISQNDPIYFEEFYKVFESLATSKINVELVSSKTEANIQEESRASCVTSEGAQNLYDDDADKIAPVAANTIPSVPATKISDYEEEIREHFTSSCEYGKDFIKFEDISDVLETCGERVPAYKLRQKLPEFGISQDDPIYFEEFYKVFESLATTKNNAELVPLKTKANIEEESGVSNVASEKGTQHLYDDADKIVPVAANTTPSVPATKIWSDYEEEIREHFTSSCDYGKDFIKFEDISDVLETCGERVPAYKLRQKLPEFGISQDDPIYFEEFYKVFESLATTKINAELVPLKTKANIQEESRASNATSEGTQHLDDDADKIAPEAANTLPIVSATRRPSGYEDEIREHFASSCEYGKDFINFENISDVLETCGERVPAYKLRQKLPELGIFQNDQIHFKRFYRVFEALTTSKIKAELVQLKTNANIHVESGASCVTSEGTQHSYHDADKIAFSEWVNSVLDKEDPDLEDYLPMDIESSTALFKGLRDGIVLCKLVNWAVPGTIDERAINRSRPNVYTIHENVTLALNSASCIGCGIVNIGPEDILRGTPHLVLGLLWQLIRLGLFSASSIKTMPGLNNLLESWENETDLRRMTPEDILMRWVNYHLKQAGSSRRIKNFKSDLKDSEVYAVLLGEICPKDITIDVVLPGNRTDADLMKRANIIIEAANQMKCRRFIRARDIVHENARLNSAFLCNCFKMYPGLETETEEEDCNTKVKTAAEKEVETREEKTFRNWINSLGVEPVVSDLHHELQDGWILLQVLSMISGDEHKIDMDSFNKPPFKRIGAIMKRVENCNSVIRLCTKMRMFTVGIAGSDIRDGNTKLTLAIIWQMMKLYTFSVLQKCNDSEKPIQESDIIQWANKRLESGGKRTRFTGFTDPTIATSKVILDLIDVIRPKSVNYALVQPGNDEVEKLLNANYAISLARKIGAKVYALPEDIAEVKSRMVMTVFACLMAREMIDLKAKRKISDIK